LPTIYDVYGLSEPVLGNELLRLAEALGVAWEEHDSDYRGIYFLASGQPFGGGRLLVQANDLRDEAGSYLQLPAFPQYRFLLFVNRCARADEVRARLRTLPQWRFLQRQVLD
jgi:hypothetical protein